MINELAKKDSQWRKIAYNICKDSYLSDDIVNEMYLKLYDCKKEINDFYVIMTIRTIFLDFIKKEKRYTDFNDITILNDCRFEIDDKQLKILNSLTWFEKGILNLSTEFSLREMEKELNINYGFLFRTIKKAREKTNKL